MNGRVYDPLLARFGTADPMTESPFSTQGWNRYSYVGNSPLNFTDPCGYCFLGCFWQSIFKGIQRAFRAVPILGDNPADRGWRHLRPPCAILASAFVAGVTSGCLGCPQGWVHHRRWSSGRRPSTKGDLEGWPNLGIDDLKVLPAPREGLGDLIQV